MDGLEGVTRVDVNVSEVDDVEPRGFEPAEDVVEGAILHELAAQALARRWEGKREMEGLGFLSKNRSPKILVYYCLSCCSCSRSNNNFR